MDKEFTSSLSLIINTTLVMIMYSEVDCCLGLEILYGLFTLPRSWIWKTS